MELLVGAAKRQRKHDFDHHIAEDSVIRGLRLKLAPRMANPAALWLPHASREAGRYERLAGLKRSNFSPLRAAEGFDLPEGFTAPVMV